MLHLKSTKFSYPGDRTPGICSPPSLLEWGAIFIDRYIPIPEELAALLLAITVPEQNVILVQLHIT
jgi:hypothetical protein